MTQGGTVDVVVPVGRYHMREIAHLLKDLNVREATGLIDSVTLVGGPGLAARAHADTALDVTVLELPNELSPSVARNLGARSPRNVNAPWIMFVDADVCVSKTFLEGLRSVLEREQPAGTFAICPQYADLLDAHSRLQLFEAREDARVLDSYRARNHVAVLRGSCMIVRTDVFTVIDGFDEALHAAEDRDLASRICEAGGHINFRSDLRVTHRPPARLANILRRKRWHAVGNAQFAYKNGNSGYLSMRAKLLAVLRRFRNSENALDERVYQLTVGVFYLTEFQLALWRLQRSGGKISREPGAVLTSFLRALDWTTGRREAAAQRRERASAW